MLLPRVAVLTTFALTSPAFADPGAIVAALPDEAAECRYFTQLCDEARTARGAAVEAEQKNKAAGGRQARSYAARREALVKSRGWSGRRIRQGAHRAAIGRVGVKGGPPAVGQSPQRGRGSREGAGSEACSGTSLPHRVPGRSRSLRLEVKPPSAKAPETPVKASARTRRRAGRRGRGPAAAARRARADGRHRRRRDER